MAQTTATATSYPVSYTTSGSINGTRYKNAIGKGADTAAVSGNDYSNGGSSSTAHIDYAFEFEGIPEDATIDSVSCQVKGHLENTSRSVATLQLYAGSTAKGTQTKFTSTSAQTITVTAGSWTRSEIDQMVLRFTIGYYGGLVNGATVTVTYTWDDVRYHVTISNQTTAVVTADPEEVGKGHSSEVKSDTITGLIITDNGTDVTSQFVEKQTTAESYSVENVGSYGFTLNSSTGYYVSNNQGVSKTAAVCRVNFHVPVAATITFTYINYAEQGYDFGVFGNIDTALNTNYYAAGSSGATITDSSYKLACNTSAHNTSSAQTLTYSMSAGDHYIDIKYSKDDASDDNNDTLQFKVAITLDEPFTPGTYYGYTISNIQGDHAIVVAYTGSGPVFYEKTGSTWSEIQVVKGFVKVSGAWVERSDLSVLFNTSTHYVKGN